MTCNNNGVISENSVREVVRFKYRVFISYSRFDKRIAQRLQKKLESYRLPRGLKKIYTGRGFNDKKAKKLGRIFMDYDELGASSELGPALNGALDDSENLIVIASGNAAQSKWVDKEVTYFKKNSNRSVFALIASGTPNDPAHECFPPTLRALDVARQPLAPDLQKESFSRCLIRLVAAIIGVSFDALWQRDRRRLRTNILLACGLILSVIIIVVTPTLIAWDRYGRQRSVDELVSETENEIANTEYERAIKTALEGLPVSKDAPWALSWSDTQVKRLASKLAAAAQLSSVSGGAGESGTVTAVSFSPNGQHILTSSEDGTATVWDAHSFSVIARCFGDQIISDKLRVLSSTPNGEFKPGLPWIRDSRFSYDGARIVSSGYFGTAWIWTVENGKCRTGPVLLGHLSDVRTAAFSRDGKRIVTASDDYTVRIWDAESGQFIRAIELPASHKSGAYTTNAEFSPDDRTIALSTSAGLIAIADPLSGRIQMILQESGANVHNVSYSNDGTRVVSSSDDGSVVIWNIETGQKVRLERQDRSVNQAVFGPRDSLILTASSDGTASVWDVNELRRKGIFRGHSKSVTSASFSPDGLSIVTGSADRTFRTWDLTRSVTPVAIVAHTDAITSASMSRDQSYFITGGGDGKVIIWGLETPDGTTLKKLSQVTVEKGAITGVAYRAEARQILVATSVGDVRAWTWDRATSTAIPTNPSLEVHVTPSERGKTSVTVSADGRFIVAGSDYDDKAGKNNRVWEVATGRSWPLKEGTRIVSLDFGNNYLIAGASENGVAQVWDATTGSLRRTLGHDMGWLTSAYFNWDSSRLAVAARDGKVRIFDVAGQQDPLNLVGHERDVNTSRFSLDGKSVVTASGDRSVRVWDGETGEEIIRFPLEEEPLDAHFSFGSKYVIATLDDGRIKLLPTDWTKLKGEELAKAVCKKRIELVETIGDREIAWENRIDSLFSRLFRQADPCRR